MKRLALSVIVTLAPLFVGGCPPQSSSSGSTVSDVSSAFEVPGVLSGTIRVRLVNETSATAQTRIVMEVLGAAVHDASRQLPAGADTLVIGPDTADRVVVTAEWLDKNSALQQREQEYVFGSEFQDGDTVIFILSETPPNPPVLVCPAPVTIDCTASADPETTRFATATSECDANPVVSFSDAREGSCPLTIRRTWTVTDSCGLSNSCEQLITVQDVTPPTIVCDADVTAACDQPADAAVPGQPEVSDDCDSSVTLTFEDQPAEGCPSAITRVWTATDDCGNTSTCSQTVRISDSTPPQLACPPDITIDCQSPTDPEFTGFASAQDTCDATPEIVYSDQPADGRGSELIRTWIAIDSCGNAATCEQHIFIADLTPPVVTCPPDITRPCLYEYFGEPGNPSAHGSPVSPFDAEFGDPQSPIDPIPLTKPEAFDVCDGSPPTITYDDVVVGEVCPLEIVRTWFISDSSGNVTTCVQTIRFEPVPR